MAKSPPGGPSTINGILYQMLYALATFGKVSILSSMNSDDELVNATVILEPSDGGDQQIHNEQKRTIQQLKIRCVGEGSWSLKEFIESVLPDLYRAVDFDKVETAFELVTEGRLGGWKDVETFFNNMTDVTDVSKVQHFIDNLDDENELKITRKRKPSKGKTETFWTENEEIQIEYTQLKLFHKIAAVLETVPEIDDDLPTVRKKLFYLLSRLKFKWSVSYPAIYRLIHEWVSQVIGAEENIDEKIGAMVAEIQRLSVKGDEPIRQQDFLDKFGLSVVPLGDFERIRLNAEALHSKMLLTRDVNLVSDPRLSYSSSFVSAVSFDKPHLMLLGDSGQGKSWLGHSIVAEALRQMHIAFAVSARRTGQENVDAVGMHLWQRVIGHGNTTPYSNTVQRLKEKIKWLPTRTLFVFIDGTLDFDSLQETCFQEWESWNTTLILNCFPKTWNQLDKSIKKRFQPIEVPDFTDHETKLFLGNSAGVYSLLDEPVKQTIRRPFFAAIFRELASGKEWGGEIEYQLYEEFWTKKLIAHTDSHDVGDLLDAAYSVFQGNCEYPFEFSDLCQTGDVETPKRLIKSKWVCKTIDGKYEFWHPRLLDWAIAKSILKKLGKGEIAEKDIVEILGRTMRSSSFRFAFVPMDVMFLALSSDLVAFSLKLQLAFEGRNHE